MAFKFPFTNYHELNLTWVLDQLKKLFEESAENVTVIENYNGRLTAVETELPLVSETAQSAAQTAANAASLAQTAKSTADTAQENAIQAQGLAGQARQEAQAAQRAADAATQAAQQAQSVAQNFDGRITEAQNNASEALEASRSFENRVQSAITTANNAAQTATNAQGIATRADQNAALALDTLNAQRSELERIGAEQAALITEETESGKDEIEALAQSVLDSIPSDYTALSNLVDKKAPVIINKASGAVASFDDGADDMKIQKLVINIEPLQQGSGDPSPDNVRQISGWTGAEIEQTGVNVWDEEWENGTFNTTTGVNINTPLTETQIRSKNLIPIKPNTTYYICAPSDIWCIFYDINKNIIVNPPYDGEYVQRSGNSICLADIYRPATHKYTTPENARYFKFYCVGVYGNTYKNDISINYPATDTEYHPYTGNQISVNWEDEAGTVYGGTLTLNPDRTGTLVVDRAMVDLGALDWAVYGTNFFYSTYLRVNNLVKIPASNDDIANIVCSKYMAVSFNNNSNTDKGISVNAGGNLFIRDTDYSDASSIATALSGVQLVYELASSQTYQLTAEQVSDILTTLYGTNNIWADTGDVEVTYPADTKLYIDGKLAELQATILENI